MIISAAYSGGTQGDLYWSRTVFLLKNINLNGATNNSFRDDGPYNFLPTRYGDVTQGSFSPFGPLSGDAPPQIGGSVYFDGSTGYFQSGTSSALTFGTGDFTIEAWINLSSTTVPQTIIAGTANGSIGFRYGTSYNGSAGLGLYKGSVADCEYAAFTFATGVWYHVAAVRQSGTVKFFVNGTQIATSGSGISGYTVPAETNFRVGASDTGIEKFKGGISNLRIAKGTAVYTAAFTPPTAPLTAVAGTSLLTCQSSTTITDASSNAFTVSRFGDVRAVSDSPFGWGSVYFDGSGDYLEPAAATNATNFGTGDFTAEFWYYPVASGQQNCLDNFGNSTTAIYRNSSGYMCYDTTSGVTRITSSSVIQNNTWTHVALVRSSGSSKLYINGVQEGSTYSDSTNYGGGAAYPRIGLAFNGSVGVNGYMSNVRIVKSAVYTANFTPPTAPLTAITGTSLLTCQDKGSIVDASTNSFTVSRVGDSKPVGMTPFAQKAAGYWSGTGFGGSNRLTAASNTAFEHGTGDFTIEGWIMPLSWGNGATLFSHWDGSGARFIVTLGAGGLSIDTTQGMSWLTNSFTATTKLNKWHHVAVTRSGSTWRFFVDGTIVGTVTYTGTYAPTSMSFNIGAYINGYTTGTSQISNVRVVKGTAIYTSAFAPPTSPLTAISGTSLLALQDNCFKDNSSNNFTVTKAGDVAVSRLNPFGPSLPAPTVNLASAGSVYFDGTGDYLTEPGSSGQYAFGTGAFTVECWINTASATTRQAIYTNNTSSGGTGPIFAIRGEGTTGRLILGNVGAANNLETADNVIKPGTWQHVALVRTGTGTNQTFIYVDGVLAATGTYSDNISTSRSAYIGSTVYYGEYFNGYISNFRVVKGTAVYTGNFTPSTSPLTAISGTSLLTAQDAVTVTDASSNNFTVTKVGDAKAVEASPFKRVSTVYGGSGYFDGSGDYLALGASSAFGFGSGDFTMECWFYKTGSNLDVLLDTRIGAGGNAYGMALYVQSNTLKAGNDAERISGGTVANGTWNHCAVTRSGNTLRLFLNGVQTSSVAFSTTLATTCAPYVGNSVANEYTNGYIANARIVKGVAVYTANFVPPVSPVDAVGGTSLLLNFGNAAIYDGSGNIALGTRNNSKTSTTIKKFSAASAGELGPYSQLYIPSSNACTFSTGDFTIEMWVYPVVLNNATLLWDQRLGTGGGAYPTAYLDSAGKLRWYVSNTDVIVGTTALPINTWTHIAVCRSSGTTRTFVNGSVDGTWADSTNYLANAVALGGDLYNAAGSGALGTCYIEDVRATKVARYTSAFSPPTEAPTRGIS